jgi:hypothetical protein
MVFKIGRDADHSHDEDSRRISAPSTATLGDVTMNAFIEGFLRKASVKAEAQFDNIGGDMAVLRDDELDAVTGGKTLAGRAKIIDGRFEIMAR